MITVQLVAVVLLLYITRLWGLQYTAMPTNEETLCSPCPGEESDYITKWFDVDNLEFDRINDDTIAISGYFVWNKEMSPKHPFSFSLDVFKFKNGQWVPTIYSIRRDHFCHVLFLPTEVWYMYTRAWEIKKCPPPAGTKIYANHSSNMVVDLPPNMEGLYRGVMHLKYRQEKCCFQLDYEINRS